MFLGGRALTRRALMFRLFTLWGGRAGGTGSTEFSLPTLALVGKQGAELAVLHTPALLDAVLTVFHTP